MTAPEREVIPVSGPWITQLEVDYVADAAATAWYGRAGEYPRRFEAAFAEYVGRRHAIALPSCTSALHLALAAAGVGPGDRVVVPDATWIASAAPVDYVGATPVFADVDRESWCLDAGALERAITPEVKAVIPVDLYGNMPDMAALQAVCARHDVALIEDAAEAVGSEHGGRRSGAFGVASTFSFHGSKTLTTGEGGMLLTDDDELYERCRFLADHGRPPGDRAFRNTEVAFKYKMSALQAALGLAQLERVEELVARKREVFAWYAEELDGVEALELNHEAEGVRNTYWMVTVLVSPELGVGKDEVLDRLREHGIDGRPFFSPLSSLPAYAGRPEVEGAAERNPVAYDLGARGVNLPSGLQMTHERVRYVCARLRAVLGLG